MSETRKLAAILCSDVVGFSRLAGADEDRILARLRALRSDLIDPTIAVHNGRVVKRTGDGSIVEFRSVVDAVRCGIEVQNAMVDRNAGVPDDRRIVFRIGIHLGDVVEESDGDLMGDGVNIAARLEGIAAPGSICLSEDAYRQVKARIDLAVTDLGLTHLKNIAEPIRVYSLQVDIPAPPKFAMQMEPSEHEKTAALLSLPDKPSIAVLPFSNMTGDIEQAYFADGITEDIITALAKLRWFFVIARNSTFVYKDRATDVRQVAKDLGVRYVLEGSVRKLGDRLRVTGQLIDATTGNHVWAERYDRSVSDLFAVQDEITASVVASIEPQLYAAENLRTRAKSPESLDAWGCVVQAMPSVWSWVAEDNKKGELLLLKAVELDPNYSRANSLLAYIYAARAHLGLADTTDTLASSLALAQRALDQDNDDPWSHLAIGYIHMVGRRSKPALEALSEALDRNPSFAQAHMIMGSTYAYNGASEQGLSHTAIATRLSPRDPIQAANLSTTGTCHFVGGRFAEAVDWQRRAVQLRPAFGTAWRSLAASAGLVGDIKLASSALATAVNLQPNLSLAWIEKYHPIVQAQHLNLYIEGLRRAGLQ
jgi:adenylate cyclase